MKSLKDFNYTNPTKALQNRPFIPFESAEFANMLSGIHLSGRINNNPRKYCLTCHSLLTKDRKEVCISMKHKLKDPAEYSGLSEEDTLTKFKAISKLTKKMRLSRHYSSQIDQISTQPQMKM
jgi:hypothetical protein